ncbi:MAG: septum formation initiator family protein [Verrucomicrobia bacterium]|nr:MAG: septum formation initiator family protein [Verrucomicrobiota bacterium]
MARPATWNWLGNIGLAVLVLLILVGSAFHCLPEIQAQQRLQQRKLELERQIQRFEKEITILDFRIRQLQTDPKAVERAARAWLGYARPGEAVIYWVPASREQTSSPPDPSPDR